LVSVFAIDDDRHGPGSFRALQVWPGRWRATALQTSRSAQSLTASHPVEKAWFRDGPGRFSATVPRLVGPGRPWVRRPSKRAVSSSGACPPTASRCCFPARDPRAGASTRSAGACARAASSSGLMEKISRNISDKRISATGGKSLRKIAPFLHAGIIILMIKAVWALFRATKRTSSGVLKSDGRVPSPHPVRPDFPHQLRGRGTTTILSDPRTSP